MQLPTEIPTSFACDDPLLVRLIASGVLGGGAVPAWEQTRFQLQQYLATLSPDNPHTLPVMANPPAVTVTNAGTTAPGTFPALTQESNVILNSASFNLEGGWEAIASTNYRIFPVATIAATGGNVGSGRQGVVWRASRIADAAVVAIRVLGSTLPYRLLVNGQYVSLTGTVTFTTSGSNWIILDFTAVGGKASRLITIEGEQGLSFRSMHIAPGDTFASRAPSPFRMLGFGDSFEQGTGATRAGDGLGRIIGDSLGIPDTWLSGVGSTGLVAKGSGSTLFNLQERDDTDLDHFLSLGPAHIVREAMGINDITLSGIEAAANSVFDTIRSKCPSAMVFVIGPWDKNAPLAPQTGYAACKASIQAAIANRPGFYFIDVEGVSFTKSDGLHPDNAGHLTLAAFVTAQMKSIINA